MASSSTTTVNPLMGIVISEKLSKTNHVLALLNLTNYSASAQRPIVAFTREYTWDIESKER